jgi:hypothetical protein
MEYSKLTESLILRMVAIGYKESAHIPLSDDDKRHREYIMECATMYNKLSENGDKIKNEMKNEMENEIKIENTDLLDTPNLFEDIPDLPLSFNFDNKEIVKYDDKKDAPTFKTNPELIELAKNNKIKFDELTNLCNEKLKNTYDSFWNVVKV